MALEKQSAISSIEVFNDGRVKIKYVQAILEDGVVLTRVNKNVLVDVEDDTSNLPARVQAITSAIWDQATIAKRRAKKAAALLGQDEF